jgi:hypothetical protein
MENIPQIIATEVARFEGGEPLANALRCAAVFVHDEFPEATASDFGDAALTLGLHRQAAMNRWNEAKKNMGADW